MLFTSLKCFNINEHKERSLLKIGPTNSDFLVIKSKLCSNSFKDKLLCENAKEHPYTNDKCNT